MSLGESEPKGKRLKKNTGLVLKLEAKGKQKRKERK